MGAERCEVGVCHSLFQCIYIFNTRKADSTNNFSIEHSTMMWEQVDEEKERLFALMTQVEQKLAKMKSATHIPLDTALELRRCSWSQVLTEIGKTAEHWKSSPNQESKRMVFIDRIGRHSESLEAWLSLLPMGDYGAR